MKSKKKLVIVLIILCVIIGVFPLVYIKNSEFGGADGAAEEVITEINPEYVPWAESIISPPGGETESLLFALQAAFGAGIVCFGFGYYVARKRFKPEESNAEELFR